jgi:hypothetical protein
MQDEIFSFGIHLVLYFSLTNRIHLSSIYKQDELIIYIQILKLTFWKVRETTTILNLTLI